MSSPIVIFFSWQSDHPAKISKGFIINTLKKATTPSKHNYDLKVLDRINIDHDTKDIKGFVDIAETVKQKIDACDHFVADLTPVGRVDASNKALQNPNVMIELGYAMSKKSADRITVIANSTFFKSPDDLPFDIRGRRAPFTYELNPYSSQKEINKQAGKLTSFLKPIFSKITKASEQLESEEEIPRFTEGASWVKIDQMGINGDLASGKQTHISIPDGPFSFIKISPFKPPFIKEKNAELDPNHNGPDLNLRIGEKIRSVSVHKGFVSTEYIQKNGRYKVRSLMRLDSNTKGIHLIDFSTVFDRNGDPYIGAHNSRTIGLDIKLDNGWADAKLIARNWGKALLAAKGVTEMFPDKIDVVIEAGFFAQGSLQVRYGDARGRLFGNNYKRLNTQITLTSDGIIEAVQLLLEDLLDKAGIYEPSNRDVISASINFQD